MASEFDSDFDLNKELSVGALLDEISVLLHESQPLGEMRQMEQEVAGVISCEEYERFLRYKEYCLNELGKVNGSCGVTGALYSAIERGFLLGYWFGMQNKNQPQQG